MAAPATLSPIPAASSLPSTLASAPSSTPGSDAPGNTFDQQLQAARNSQSSDSSSSSDAPPASTPGASRQGDPSSSGAAKSTQESNMAAVGTASTTSAAGAASTASANASSKTNAATNGQTVDAALAALAQTAQTATGAGSGDAAPSATAKAPASKTDATDDEGAASLAGAMLAMLGQVNGNMAGAQSDADDGTVSADGSSSGQAKAAMALQGLNANGQASAADGATGGVMTGTAAGNAVSLANFASMLGNAAGAAADTGTDTHKATSGLDALAFAATPMLPQTANAQAVALPQLQMSSPTGSAGFAGELGQQVMWLGQQGVQQAKIRLNPQDLGSLDVHVTVNQNRIDVVFSAQHPAAVTAVQQSLPQLDNMLNRHGLSLGHAEVGQQQSGSGHSRGEGGSGAQASSGDDVGEVQGASLSAATTSQIGLLDAFA
ncbi:flagellar hook-length control protein FliK [Rhodanobacter sp. 7MK24]|uniref:flagellar hook-length control protein FliK n=1 Tax=Rhodanobacter sp. 7MK24 TaxID=2775922 RepID=UPI00177AB9EF|nr:flagellar hook-length control protein FliK [Rhodanobacter sp. 7MK24]MBD8881919.1 flagellar hook-length control protein FliK [Rhodanobacter sp. 7MK24]